MTRPDLLRRLKRRLISRLATQVMEEEARLRAATKVCAIVSPTATLAPEAIIENGAGIAERIFIGDSSFVRGKLLIFPHGGTIRVGDWCYIGHRTEIWSMESVTIGNRVLIAHGVSIVDTTAHSLDPQERHQHFQQIITHGMPSQREWWSGVHTAPITIEDDVWISFNATILKGVRIGAGSVVAAGSIVTHDIPPGTLYRCQVTPVMTPLAGR